MRMIKAMKFVGKVLLGLLALVVLLVAVVWFWPVYSRTTDIDFTRHLADYQGAGADNFFGVEGDGRLIITGIDAGESATISLNGEQIIGPGAFASDASLEVPVVLVADN